MFVVRHDDLSGEPSRRLLEMHLRCMHASSPPGSVFALNLAGLTGPDISVWSVWDREAIMAIDALKMLSNGTGEVKSMRTHPDQLRRGAAALLRERIIAEARARGLSRLSLETGSGPAFEPALALYRKRGFVTGVAFSSYEPTAFNQFLHLRL